MGRRTLGAGDNAGYGVATLVQKSDKSASHVYAHLSLLQPIPKVAEAFSAERITPSHANLPARITHEAQATAYEQCWRKDWQDKEPHLLPANTSPRGYRLTSLSIADAPFDREDLGFECADHPIRKEEVSSMPAVDVLKRRENLSVSMDGIGFDRLA